MLFTYEAESLLTFFQGQDNNNNTSEWKEKM